MKSGFLLVAGVATAVFAAFPYTANAETTTTHTITQSKELPNVNQINFQAFDVNGDGSFSMAEVGEILFKCFDQDGNHNIDNIEWDRKSVMTIAPMEKTTFKFYDSNDDGIAEDSSYTYETFYAASGLIKFDESQDGLSPSDFVGEIYQKLDTDQNNMIDLEEWKVAYLESRPKHVRENTYNN